MSPTMTMERPLIPRSVLFSPPDRRAPALSPDGRELAFLAPADGVVNVWTGSLRGGHHPVSRAKIRDVQSFRWAGDHVLYTVDRDGDEAWHLHTVHVGTGHDRDLTPFDGVQAILLSTTPDRPGTALIALNRDDPARHDAYRVDLATGALHLAARDEGFGTINGTWLADGALRVRAALRPTADGGAEVLVRAAESDPWRLALTVGLDDEIGTRLLSFDASGAHLYLLTSLDGDTAALCELEIATGRLRVLYRDPTHDVVSAAFHPVTRNPRWATVERERAEHVTLDGSLPPELDGGDVSVLSTDQADRIWLVQSAAPDRPTMFAVLDRSTGTVTPLFEDRPSLRAHPLAPRTPYTVVARDGMKLPAYATFPGSPASLSAAGGGHATVLLVHGGPWERDHWRLDPVVQWLADRGYLVLQVNFRGSTGYGKAFVAAGNHQWGAAMQDDLTDTVRDAVARGWTDGGRVAIVGGSYGGYAALAGAAFTPSLYRCAVAISGPSDLRTLLRGIPPYWESLRALWQARVGDPEADAELLCARSPLAHADRITVPVLIAQGGNDPRVPRRESDQIVAALKEHGVEHEYLLYPDEGHAAFRPHNELHLAGRIEHFLARHLGGRAEP
jgi:dipeptidyl aminopeptidase/acylaminoacyl peptidase